MSSSGCIRTAAAAAAWVCCTPRATQAIGQSSANLISRRENLRPARTDEPIWPAASSRAGSFRAARAKSCGVCVLEYCIMSDTWRLPEFDAPEFDGFSDSVPEEIFQPGLFGDFAKLALGS